MKPKPKKKAARKRPAPAKKKAARKAPAKRAKAPVAPVVQAAPAPQTRKKNRKPKASRVVDRKRAFLAAFRILASVKAAAKAAGIGRPTHYEWLRMDADYHRDFRAAIPEATQALEDEAVERATRGVFEPNVFQGRFIYPQEQYVAVEAHGKDPAVMAWRDKPGAGPIGMWKKSDPLLMFLLRGWMPEKYKHFTALELGGVGGGPIALTDHNLSKLTDDELASLRILAQKLSADSDDSG